jgi:5'(3')-deoxyribonucleotidase
MNEGLRYNNGKIRYDLLEPFAIQELAKVFTKGSEKYEPHNWLKGMNWSKMRASLGRHLASFDMGHDFDIDPNCENCKKGDCTNHTGLYHIAQVAWNAMAILSYYRYYPEGDDRMLSKPSIKRIGIDIDEVLADFLGGYCKLHDIPYPKNWIFDRDFEERFKEIQENSDFWLGLKTILKATDLKFEPVAYITSRPESVRLVTEKWLADNGFSHAPIYFTEDKLSVCKDLKINIFIDDKYDTFVKLNRNGILCYLFDAEHNKKYHVGYKRININTINSILW